MAEGHDATMTQQERDEAWKLRKEEMQKASRWRERSVSQPPYTYKVRNAQFEDDGTTTWLWRPHTLTFVVLLALYVIYKAVHDDSSDSDENLRRGMSVAVVVFLGVAALQFNDGPFVRPHPMIWRIAFGLSVLYEMFLIVLLFQRPEDGRQMLKFFDPSLGERLPEKTYADDCTFYDVSTPDDPFHNPLSKADRFVIAHFFGWVVKALAFRDAFILHTCSILFEFFEYTLSFQLPNFAECWWDHWLYDVLLCNTGGILVGLWLCRYFEMKSYCWRGLSSIPTTAGKLKRAAAQFTPYSWTKFEWHALSDFKHWIATISVCIIMLSNDLNAFYLKYVLWVPESNNLNIYRLLIAAPMGAVAVAEIHEFINDPDCKRLGQQATVVFMVIITESLISWKVCWCGWAMSFLACGSGTGASADGRVSLFNCVTSHRQWLNTSFWRVVPSVWA